MHPPPGRILMVGPNSLKNVCRAVPVLASLRCECEEAQIDWIIQESLIDAIRAHPMLDAVIACPAGMTRSVWNPSQLVVQIWWMSSALRDLRYDRVVDVRGTTFSRLCSWWLRAPQRVDAPDVRSAPARDARLFVATDDTERWLDARTDLGLHGRYAIFSPYSRWKSKLWPAERWHALAAEVLDSDIETIAFVGLEGEQDALRAFMPADSALRARCVDLCGCTDAGALLAATASASLVVSIDSAPLHVAAGLGTPCVGIFGPTDPRRSGFLGEARWALQGDFAECEPPLHYRDRRLDDRLMRRVTVDRVAARARVALQCAVRTAVSA